MLDNPAIAAIFGAFCVGVMHIITSIVFKCVCRRSLIKDFKDMVRDYLNEDIKYLEITVKDFQESFHLKFDDIQILLTHSYYLNSLRNDMYLLKDKEFRKNIYSYLYNKNRLLLDIHCIQTTNNHEDSFKSGKVSELQSLINKAESLLLLL